MNKKLFLFDWLTFLVYVVLSLFGILNIYSSTFSESEVFFNYSSPAFRQFLFMIISIFIGVLIINFNTNFFQQFSSLIYIFSIILLLGLFIFGETIRASTSWYNFFGINFQPTDFAKLATSLAVAKLMSEIEINIKKNKDLLKLVILISLPSILIIFQNDLGSSIVFASFFFVFFREGLSYNYFTAILLILSLSLMALVLPTTLLFLIILFVILFLYSLSKKNNKKTKILPYIFTLSACIIYILSVNYVFNNVFEQRHRDRINIFLGKEYDSKGIGYNLNQSIIAIGSGGFNGKGFLQGTQTKGDFVPEQHTDYIFSTIGEEWGFWGCFGLIFLYTILILRIIFRSENHKNKFCRIFSYSISSILTIHFMINIGMSLGLFPTIGIPLPLISYGGSSFIAFSCMIFIYLNLDLNRLN
mgnify:FL=1